VNLLGIAFFWYYSKEIQILFKAIREIIVCISVKFFCIMTKKLAFQGMENKVEIISKAIFSTKAKR